VALTARYKCPADLDVKPALLYALKTLVAKHPILSAIPWDVNTTQPYFVRPRKIENEQAVTFVDYNLPPADFDWRQSVDRILEEEHNTPFEASKSCSTPFWRLRVLKSEDIPDSFILILVFHHSIMDTKSALSLHQELEENLNQYFDSSSSRDTLFCPDTALLPSLEDLYEFPISPSFCLSQSTYSEPSSESWTAAPQAIPVKTRFSSFLFSESETREIKVMSKLYQSSVTATLQALIAQSIFVSLPSEYTILQGDCAVSLRRFLPMPITCTSLGCYVGSLSVIYHRRQSFDWKEAHRTKAAIAEAVAGKGRDMQVAYLNCIPDMHAWMKQKLGKKRMGSFELSNVGETEDQRADSSVRIEGMLFSQSSSACSAAIKVSAVTGRDGKLALGFTWQEGIVEDTMIEKIKKALKREVANWHP